MRRARRGQLPLRQLAIAILVQLGEALLAQLRHARGQFVEADAAAAVGVKALEDSPAHAAAQLFATEGAALVGIQPGKLLLRHVRPLRLQLLEGNRTVAVGVDRRAAHCTRGIAQFVPRQETVVVLVGIGKLLCRGVRSHGLQFREVDCAVAVGVEFRPLRVVVRGCHRTAQHQGGNA